MSSLSEKDLVERMKQIKSQVEASDFDHVAVTVEKDIDYDRIITGLKNTFGAERVQETGSPKMFPTCNRVLILK